MTGNQLATFALTAFRQRQANARKAIENGRIAPGAAADRLAPWAAAACLLGADLRELREDFAAIVTIKGPPLSDAARRSMVAGNLCPPAEMVAALAAARDKAMLAAWPQGHGDPVDDAKRDAAIALSALADRFAAPPFIHPRFRPAAPLEQAA